VTSGYVLYHGGLRAIIAGVKRQRRATLRDSRRIEQTPTNYRPMGQVSAGLFDTFRGDRRRRFSDTDVAHGVLSCNIRTTRRVGVRRARRVAAFLQEQRKRIRRRVAPSFVVVPSWPSRLRFCPRFLPARRTPRITVATRSATHAREMKLVAAISSATAGLARISACRQPNRASRIRIAAAPSVI